MNKCSKWLSRRRIADWPGSVCSANITGSGVCAYTQPDMSPGSVGHYVLPGWTAVCVHMCPPFNITGNGVLPHVPAVYSYRLLVLQRPIVLVSNAAALPPALAGAHLRHLPFQRPAPSAAARVLAGVCAAEGRPLAPAALHALVLRCRCDLRCAGACVLANSLMPGPKACISCMSIRQVMYVHSRQTALYVKSPTHVIICGYRLALCLICGNYRQRAPCASANRRRCLLEAQVHMRRAACAVPEPVRPEGALTALHQALLDSLSSQTAPAPAASAPGTALREDLSAAAADAAQPALAPRQDLNLAAGSCGAPEACSLGPGHCQCGAGCGAGSVEAAAEPGGRPCNEGAAGQAAVWAGAEAAAVAADACPPKSGPAADPGMAEHGESAACNSAVWAGAEAAAVADVLLRSAGTPCCAHTARRHM